VSETFFINFKLKNYYLKKLNTTIFNLLNTQILRKILSFKTLNEFSRNTHYPYRKQLYPYRKIKFYHLRLLMSFLGTLIILIENNFILIEKFHLYYSFPP
jgi:hypothetical protein